MVTLVEAHNSPFYHIHISTIQGFQLKMSVPFVSDGLHENLDNNSKKTDPISKQTFYNRVWPMKKCSE